MYPSIMRFIVIIPLFVGLMGCVDPAATNENDLVHPVAIDTGVVDEFADYWYRGQAEITSYDLEQARYGELRSGTAVLVFVTEDFSKGQITKV